jgi:hypothetical protein
VYNDKNLTCADCGQEFVFTASEQDFYAQRGFTEPRTMSVVPRQPEGRRGTRMAAASGAAATVATVPAAAIPPAAAATAAAAAVATAARRRLSRPRAARDVQRHLLQLRPRGPGPVPPDQRQAGLLLDCFRSQRGGSSTKPILSARARSGPAEPAAIPTRVVSRPGSFDSPARRWTSGCRAWTTLDCVAGCAARSRTLKCARSAAPRRLASLAHARRTQSGCPPVPVALERA